MAIIDNSRFNLLERSLNAAALRQKVIANNIANVDTPNFKRSDVVFEDLLQKEIETSSAHFVGKRTDPRHFEIGGGSEAMPEIVTDQHSAMNNNLNNVDIDREMALMAENELRYNALIQQLNYELRQIRIAIDGRR
ncbi:MAG TPA: flagellar basal body rod protein FlgB [Bacilli bacterium]